MEKALSSPSFGEREPSKEVSLFMFVRFPQNVIFKSGDEIKNLIYQPKLLLYNFRIYKNLTSQNLYFQLLRLRN